MNKGYVIERKRETEKERVSNSQYAIAVYLPESQNATLTLNTVIDLNYTTQMIVNLITSSMLIRGAWLYTASLT